MYFTSIPILAILGTASLVTALPTSVSYAAAPSSPTTAPSGEFFLVTSDQSERSTNTSALRGVSATTVYQDQPGTSTLVLRLLDPGYNSLPSFTLTTSATLSTLISTGRGDYTYDTVPVVAGHQLQFAWTRTAGNIALSDGYLVSVDGRSDGWTICADEHGTELLYWKGQDASCVKTFLQAVQGAPYRKM